MRAASLTAGAVVQDDQGHCGIATGDKKLVRASSAPTTADQLRRALGQTLGADTALVLRDVDTKCTLAALFCLYPHTY